MPAILRREDWVQALGGGQGGFIAIATTLPMETIQKMQGTSDGKPPSVLECVCRVYKTGGIPEFWRGITPLAGQCFIEKFCYFLPYSVIVHFYESRYGLMGYGMNLLLGYFAELLRIPFNYPLEVISTYTQTHPEEPNLLSTIRTIYTKQGGFPAFYRGMSGYLLISGRPAISMVVFDQVKRIYLQYRGLGLATTLSFLQAFLLGAVGRLVATAVCYPCFQQKCRRQSGKSGMVGLYKAEGMVGLYKGFWSEVLRGVAFNGVMMAVKETIENFNRGLLGLQ